MLQLPAYLENVIRAFDQREFALCIELAERLREGHGHDPWLFYLLARAYHERGEFAAASEYADRSFELDPQNDEVRNLHQALAEEMETVAQCPDLFRSSTWCAGRTVVRIGGAVPILDRHLSQARKVINVNAAETTLGARNEVDVLGDAHVLPTIADASVDAVVSSHTIEHLVNPLLALLEWKRILRPGGHIYSSIPSHRLTFDHKRKPTELAHLVADLEGGQTGMDWFHAEEFLRNYDCSRDLIFRGDEKGHFAEYIKAPNLHTHFHVFDLALVYAMHQYLGFTTLACFEAGISVHYFGLRP